MAFSLSSEEGPSKQFRDPPHCDFPAPRCKPSAEQRLVAAAELSLDPFFSTKDACAELVKPLAAAAGKLSIVEILSRVSVSTRILGRRAAPFPPFLISYRVPHGFYPRS